MWEQSHIKNHILTDDRLPRYICRR